MASELRNACFLAIEQAAAPLTAAQAAAAAGRNKSKRFSQAVIAELTQLAADAQIFEWPKFGKSRIFSKQSFHDAVKQALRKCLETQPLTAAAAAKPVSRLLKRVSEKSTLAELNNAAPRLASLGELVQVAANRQTVVYLSLPYLERLLPRRPNEPSLTDILPACIEQLQSAPGNYVRVDHLRNAPELRKPLDRAAVALAREGKLVLARYDGPRPVPEPEKGNYIEDEQGELFIGAAIPRGERVTA